VVVQADGTLRDIQVVKPAGYGMDERAVETVKKWRFRAGTKDGTPVDVRIQAAVGFRIAPEANTWGAGPLVFDSASAITRPVLKSGTMPKAVRQAGNEIVLLQFTVGPSGEVGDIHALQGSESTSLPVLTSSLLKWRFAPASNGAVSLPAVGKVLLIKGEDQFRYQVSSAFRDSGAVRLPARESDQVSPSPANADPGPITVVVPVKLRLEPDEAKKQLVYQVPAQYPTDAKLAGIQGTVVLGITIGTDGEVKDLREISGPPQLIPAAVAAVKQWRYRPALYGGRPWEASTEVEIQFKLPE
jgi:TonB family protein